MALAFALAGQALPQTYTWTGGSSTSANWNDGANWAGSVAPISGFSTNLQFTSGSQTTNVNNFSGFDVDTLTFAAENWAISGNSIGLASGGEISATSGNTTVNNNLQEGADGHGGGITFSAASGASLTLDGTTSGSGQLNFTGAGQINVDKSMTATGKVAISGGGTVVANVAIPFGVSNAIALTNDSTLELLATNVATSYSPQNSLSLDSGSSLYLYSPSSPSTSYNEVIGNLSGSGSIYLGTATLTAGSSIVGSSFSGIVQGAATSGGWAGNFTGTETNTFTLQDATIDVGVLSLDNTVIDGGVLNVGNSSGGGFSLLNVTIENGAVVTVSKAGSTSMFQTVATVTGAGTVLNAGGTLSLETNGSQTLTVSNGAELTASNFSEEPAGGPTGGTTNVTITGTGSSLLIPSVATIGNTFGGDGLANLTIANGAMAHIGTLSFINEGSSLLDVDKGVLTTNEILGTSNTPMILTNPVGGYALVLGGNFNSGLQISFTDGSDGVGGIQKVGTGTITVTINQTYTGLTDVTKGGWTLSDVKTYGGYEVASGASLTAQSGSTMNLNNFALQTDAGGATTLSDVTVNGGTIKGAGTVTLSQDADGSSPTFNTTTSRAGANIVNQSSGTYLSDFTNGGVLTDTAGLTWDGGTNVSSGTVNFSASNTKVDELESDGVMNVAAGAKVSNSVSSLTLGAGSRTYVGTATSHGGTVDLGGQTLELNGGLLVNNGTIQNGLVNINYGSTAKGAGNYAGGYSVNYDGTFLAGNSPGTVNSGSAFWNEGGMFDFQIDNATGVAGTNWGLNDVNGTLTISAGSTAASIFTVDVASLLSNGTSGMLANFNPNQSYTWLFLATTGGISGFTTSDFALNLSGFTNTYNGTFSLVELDGGKDLGLRYTSSAAVPTPPGVVVVGFGLVGLLIRRRKNS